MGSELRPTTLGVGDTVSIPQGVLHRLESTEGADILEVAKGTFDEGDIVRVEDDYSRQVQRGGAQSARESG